MGMKQLDSKVYITTWNSMTLLILLFTSSKLSLINADLNKFIIELKGFLELYS